MSPGKKTPKPKAQKPKPKKRRWLKRLLICAAFALTGCILILATSPAWIPWIVARETRKRFDLETRIGRLSFFSLGMIEVEELSVRPLAVNSSAAGFAKLVISYDSLGALLKGRTESVEISGPFLNLDSALQIAIPPSEPSGEPSPPLQELLAYLPKRLSISGARLEAFGERLSAPTVTLEAQDSGELRFSAHIAGVTDLVSAQELVQTPLPDATVFLEAQADVSGDAFELSRAALLLNGEEVLTAKAQAGNWMLPETYQFEASLPHVSIEEVLSAILPNYASLAGGTLRDGSFIFAGRGESAEDLAAHDLAASINLRDAWLSHGEISCKGLSHDFSIQTTIDKEFLTRDLGLNAEGTLGAISVSGQTITGLHSTLSLQSDFDPLAFDLIGVRFKQTLSNADDSSSSVSIDLATEGRAGFTISKNLIDAEIEKSAFDLRLDDGTETQIGLNASLRYDLDDPAAPGNAAQAKISALGGKIDINAAVNDTGLPSAEMKAAGISLEEIGALLVNRGFSTQPFLSGELGFSLKSKAKSNDNATFELLFNASDIGFEEPSADLIAESGIEVNLEGEGRIDWETGALDAKSSGEFKINNLVAELDAAGVYVDEMNIDLPIDSLSGAYSADGSVSANAKLGKGAMEFAYFEAAEIALEEMELEIGDGALECAIPSGDSGALSAKFSGLGFSIAELAGLAVNGSIEMLGPDLRPNLTIDAIIHDLEELTALLDLPVDASVQGAVSAKTAISAAQSGNYLAEAEISANNLAFEYGELAKGEDLVVEGSFDARIDPSGKPLGLGIEDFALACGSVLAGGIAASDIAVRLEAEESFVSWTLENLSILGGEITGSGRITVELGDEIDWEASASMRFDGIDLEEVTRSLEPPDTYMAGKIGGTVEARIRKGALISFNFDMEADENTFALNRERVVQLLLLGEESIPGLTRARLEEGLDQRFKDAEMIPFSKLKGSGSFTPLDPENPERSDEFHALISIANEMIDYTLEPTLDRGIVVEYLAEQQKLALGLQ